MKERNVRLVEEKNGRQLWFREIYRPDGVWVPILFAREFIAVEGRYIKTSCDTIFSNESEGRLWVSNG